MNSADGNMDPFRSSAAGGSGASRRYVLPFLASNFLQAPLSALLEYSGILRQDRATVRTMALSAGD
ncbi:hypothetical protein HPP92_007553 [Vanilla planifolia]|uniref:Uncharacterized protein n=1 Tax=Vanilla planifolia TaxID=51239 RepID=A0A835RMM0_VANPL|nr:hypothetical protein HPP92_007553 [Vanilla planifolia]